MSAAYQGQDGPCDYGWRWRHRRNPIVPARPLAPSSAHEVYPSAHTFWSANPTDKDPSINDALATAPGIRSDPATKGERSPNPPEPRPHPPGKLHLVKQV